MAGSEIKRSDAARIEARTRAADYLIRRHYFRWPEALPWLIAIACYFAFPDRMTFGSQVLVMVIFALSLDLILGYAGIVTLGHAAFFGIGAYIAALGALRLGWNEPISNIFAGGLAAGAIGAVVGWFILRYRGLTLLMLTIAFAATLQESGNLRSDITGGYDGLPGLTFDPLLGRFDYDLYGHTNFLYALAVLAVIFYFVRRVVYSPFGQALTGIRENVRRMHAIGSPVHRRLVTVYAISAAIAGVAGALFTQTNAYVTLAVFDFDVSAKVMVMLILGGTGRLYGPFLGAAVYMTLEDYFSKLSPTFWQFGIGLLLVLAVLFARRGLLGLFEEADKIRISKENLSYLVRQHLPSPTVGEMLNPLNWRNEYRAALLAAAVGGAILGFGIVYAINTSRAGMLVWIGSKLHESLIWALGGAVVAGIAVYVFLMLSDRSSQSRPKP